MSCEETFVQKLRERGFRMTPQREMVLAVLHGVEGFATAEDIHAQVQERSPVVDVSTVYRTLELLEELQMVAHMDGPDGQRHYELLGLHGLHHHLHCRICGEVVPLPHAETQPLMKQLEDTYGFAVEPESWTFTGICSSCRSAS